LKQITDNLLQHSTLIKRLGYGILSMYLLIGIVFWYTIYRSILYRYLHSKDNVVHNTMFTSYDLYERSSTEEVEPNKAEPKDTAITVVSKHSPCR